MKPEQFDFGVWWSDEDGCYLARALTLQAGTGYGETPEAALADAIALAGELVDLGHLPAAEPISDRIDWTPERIHELRRSLSLTQEAFAQLLNVTPHAVRHWEQGNRNVSGASSRLLDFVAASPGLVHRWIIDGERQTDTNAAAD